MEVERWNDKFKEIGWVRTQALQDENVKLDGLIKRLQKYKIQGATEVSFYEERVNSGKDLLQLRLQSHKILTDDEVKILRTNRLQAEIDRINTGE